MPLTLRIIQEKGGKKRNIRTALKILGNIYWILGIVRVLAVNEVFWLDIMCVTEILVWQWPFHHLCSVCSHLRPYVYQCTHFISTSAAIVSLLSLFLTKPRKASQTRAKGILLILSPYHFALCPMLLLHSWEFLCI